MVKLIDCTLRDGGYYNAWNFSIPLMERYLSAMSSLHVDYVELGFRFFEKNYYIGPCGYMSDRFIRECEIPDGLDIGVMVNASELINFDEGLGAAINRLFSEQSKSPVSLVRIASHAHEFADSLKAARELTDKGYAVGVNLMQITNFSEEEISRYAEQASDAALDVLYFADSLGELTPTRTVSIVEAIRSSWNGDIGIHTHDNMGLAISNSLAAIDKGVSWVDATVTGMGRGPGNAKTEFIILELEAWKEGHVNMIPLLELIKNDFEPLQRKHGWGTNTFYYLAGKLGIHPTYVQEMITDPRYVEEDILEAINYLSASKKKKFTFSSLDEARQMFNEVASGNWCPRNILRGRDVFILGAGCSVSDNRRAIESYISEKGPFVIALNTQNFVQDDLVDLRAVCHPGRLVADLKKYERFPQPIVAPVSALRPELLKTFVGSNIYDFGVQVTPGKFSFDENSCILPVPLVAAYALAISASGQARKVFLAGFDGYSRDDPRFLEMETIFQLYRNTDLTPPLTSLTPSRYNIPISSIYAN